MALTEAAGRRAVRLLVRAQHAAGDILASAPLDPTAGTLAVAVEQQRDHHRRVVGPAAPALIPLGTL